MKKDPLDLYKEVKEECEDLIAASQKASGAMEQLLSTLKEEFGCSSIEEAEKLLKKMEKESKESQKRLLDKLEKFRSKWTSSSNGFPKIPL